MPLLHSPATHGFDPQRLTRIDQLASHYLNAGHFAGLVTLVSRRGHLIHLGCHGFADAASARPMRPDTIFRIFSMTKPVTGTALMICLEEGLCNVTDPVSAYLPAFADLKVWQDGALVPLNRPVTIQDLYRHTAGLTYGGLFGDHPVDQMYAKANIGDPARSNSEFLTDIARMPLRYQPGTRWHYSMATDVLGSLIEILTGQPFGLFLQERIFDPLGMVDTSFRLDPAKAPRLATLYKVTPGNSFAPVNSIGVDYGPDARFESGGGGLLSTPLDYLRFAQCLLNDGVLDGQRILGRKSVEFMASNALTPAQLPFGFDNAEPFHGFGYGVCVKVMQNPAAGGWFGSIGDYGWGGYAETYLVIDPEEELVALIMAQCIPSMHYPIRKQFRAAVYQALV